MPASFVTLTNRGLITIEGSPAHDFLQNIISNDVDLLNTHQNIHACLLTAQGKFLHDFYVIKTDTGYALDCEGGERTQDLARRFMIYKLRTPITIKAQQDVTIYANNLSRMTNKPDGEEISFEDWDMNRIKKSIPDGSRDAEIGVSTLAELNLDQEAVSYTKGCYVGQELVARMHNRNLGKKHLVAARFKPTPPNAGTVIENTGLMRSSRGNIGLILMNRDREAELRETQTDDSQIYLLGL
ncbi:MAG: folate-binding protein [Alphaproteobacteria bacterium]|nr:folate-binding protein [Alphaproteobacteria bacterium]